MLLNVNINPPTGATNVITTVLPAKSDSDVMFVYKVICDLWSIDHLCINPINTQVIYQFTLDDMKCTS